MALALWDSRWWPQLLGMLVLATAPVGARADSPCANPASGPAQRLALTPGRPLTIELATSQYGTLIEEAGGDLSYGLDGAEPTHEIDIKPPRLGVAGIAGTTTRLTVRLRESQAPSAVVIRRDCLDSAQISFFTKLEAIYRDVIAAGPSAATAAVSGLEDESRRAADPRERAWLLHTKANAMLTAGQSVAAADAFMDARQAWLALADRARAGVALMAAAEDASRAGAYDRAESALQEAMLDLRQSGMRYYELRAQAALCLVATRRGQLEQGIVCEEAVAARLGKAGERAEAGARQVSLANQWLKRGDTDRARTQLLIAEKHAQALNPTVRARLSLATGAWLLQTGDLSAAGNAMAQASTGFGSAGLPNEQAIVDLKLARLAGLAGARHEEMRLLDRTVASLNEDNAPEHIATASLRLAQAHLESREFRAAELALARAQSLCARIGKQDCLERVALVRIDMALDHGQADAARALLDALPSLQLGASQFQAPLLQARLQLLANHPDQALATLTASPATLDIESATEFAVVRAAALHASGDPQAARRELATSLEDASASVAPWPSMALKVSARRHLARLQELFFDLVEPESDGLSNEGLAQIIAAMDAAAMRPLSAAGANSRLTASQRAAMSEAILTDAPVDTRGIFLGLLAIHPGNAESDASGGQRVAAKVQLAANELLLLPLPGKTRFTLVAVAGDQARICARMERAAYNEAVARYESAMAGTQTNLAALETDTRYWYGQVKSCGGAQEAIDHWRVVAVPGAAQLPWAWIAAQAEHADLREPALSISFRASGEVPATRLTGTQATILNLDLPGAEGLPFAQAELSRVRNSLTQHGVSTRVVEADTLDAGALLSEFNTTDQWLHLIGHGNAPDYGPLYAGIWLNDHHRPALLAYPEIAANASRAKLVVLSACGAGPTGLSSQFINLQLAEAFTSAGAAHVIAATNALSDSAAPYWTEVFYQSLLRTGDPAIALRDARQGLRRSPHFRHPRFWAGLNHYLGDVPSEAIR